MGVPEWQRRIYTVGTQGKRPRVPVSATELELEAHAHMEARALAYVAGGAGSEETQRANRTAFERWQITPRVLRDVTERDTSVTLFGRKLTTPLLLSPIGVCDMAHPDGDAAVAAACRQTGTPMIFSNQASVTMEKCATILGDSPRWFQLYWSKSRELVASFVQRAEKCGCEAIVVTLDTPLLGWRPRDLDLGSLPFARGLGLAQYFSDPVFQNYLDDPTRKGPPEPKPKINLQTFMTARDIARAYPGGFWKNLRSNRPLRAIRQFLDIYSRTDLCWPDLAYLREKTRLPIVLKGILSAEDAHLAVDAGVDGIWVSNHGGRQLDGAIASLDALVNVVSAVAGKIPILFDSGIRCGSDMFKALALGATAVCLGRPYIYGLALAGEQGVVEVICNLIAEFELQMSLSGCRNLDELHETISKRT